MSIIPEPWERQPGEPSKAYDYFCIYRDLGPQERSLRNAGKKQGKTWGSYQESLSSKWHWVERCKEYDAYQDKLNRELEEKERKEMAALHLKTAKAMLTKGISALQKLPADDMKAADVTKMIETAVKLDRLVRGETTDKVETSGTGGTPSVVQIYIPSNGKEVKE